VEPELLKNDAASHNWFLAILIMPEKRNIELSLITQRFCILTFVKPFDGWAEKL
jgi:hypothetical protein